MQAQKEALTTRPALSINVETFHFPSLESLAAIIERDVLSRVYR